MKEILDEADEGMGGVDQAGANVIAIGGLKMHDDRVSLDMLPFQSKRRRENVDR